MLRMVTTVDRRAAQVLLELIPRLWLPEHGVHFVNDTTTFGSDDSVPLVEVGRNVYESIANNFLSLNVDDRHKCWLPESASSLTPTWRTSVRWNGTLCDYLTQADINARPRLALFAEVALGWLTPGMERRESKRTLHVCYESLVDPGNCQDVLRRMDDFFSIARAWPGSTYEHACWQVQDVLSNQPPMATKFSSRLKGIAVAQLASTVMQLDTEAVLDGRLARVQRATGCSFVMRARVTSVHKMGMVAASELGQSLYIPEDRINIGNNPAKHLMPIPTVLLIRNVINSIVSGYVYHKAGIECYHQGILAGQQVERLWKESAWNTTVTFVPHPPSAGRNLCRYLATTSEIEGIAVYAEFALRKFITRVANIAAQQSNSTGARILLICLEEVTDPKRCRGALQRMDNFLNITRGAARQPLLDAYMKYRCGNGIDPGHSKSHLIDDSGRDQLAEAIRLVDSRYLGGRLVAAQASLKCGAK
mmetsp:Transcript_6141/g.10309  ORF Transcript_6141/g.10309 Transcript_6141/m.10309 type:complete len:477 (-) Transcript_6141:439-1869(-)